jgi:hypothetical protein
MKHIILSLGLLALASAAAEADLRYKMRLEVRTPAAELKAVLPSGETVMLIKADTIRIEHAQGAARSVLLIRPDGRFVLNLEARTSWRIPETTALLTPPATAASSTFRRTGELKTILGLQAERVEVTMAVPVPTTLLRGFPAVLPMTGELWLSDAYRPYATSISRAFGLPGAPTPALEGIVLHQVVRNAQFGIEIEHVVTELIEAPLAAEIFELPEGFRVIGPAGRP